MRIGILGGGQLARMLVHAGEPLGFEFRIFSTHEEESTRGLAEYQIGSFEDEAALTKFAQGLDVATFEFENITTQGVAFLESKVPVFPSSRALAVGQDRAKEKATFVQLGIPTTDFAIVDSSAELRSHLTTRTLPCIIKTTRMGYDGKGQLRCRSKNDLDSLSSLGAGPYLIENLVPFEREVSLLGVRGRSGEIAIYSLVENLHTSGILSRSIAPAPIPAADQLQEVAVGYMTRLLKHLDYCGVLAIEFFQVGAKLIANEIAPRVHNTGHWSIEGAVTSQFENHLRAITGLPLGNTANKGYSVMYNIIGRIPTNLPPENAAGVAVHLYGKSARPGRKLGHLTFTGTQLDTLLASGQKLNIPMVKDTAS